MPVAGLVLCLDPSPEAQAGVTDALARDPRFTLGALRDGRLAVAVETRSREEDRAYMDALQATPGVLAVQVAWCDVSDLVGG